MKWLKWMLLILLIIFVIGGIWIYVAEPRYAYVPPTFKILNSEKTDYAEKTGYDLWGDSIGLSEKKWDRDSLTPQHGAVKIDDQLLQLGRKAFYEETFGNEVFLTDIMGIVDGALTIPQISKAILKLKGKGTTNLKVELAKDVEIGNRKYKKGDLIDTGLDVPKGALVPLGMPIRFSEGRIKVGISCAACHATVDPATKRVIEGAPNSDLNAGLLMALATNSAAYFTHTDREALKEYLKEERESNQELNLPDPEKLEKAVDAVFANWPRGNFDSTIDFVSNPAQIPDSFTLGDHPYGWSGFAMAGPFKGLSAFSNNVHAQNSDSLGQADASPVLFGISKEKYLGIILQNAANPKYRYQPEKGEMPSAFFAKLDPTPGVPGVNEMVKSPSYPKVNLVAPDGLMINSKGYRFGEQVNGMAAWQNTLKPPKGLIKADKTTVDLGRQIFQRAGCISCHSGNHFTNHRVIAAEVIKTEPSRAKALKKTEKIFGDTLTYPFTVKVPFSDETSPIRVPIEHLDDRQIQLAYGHGKTEGGYKVPSLIGLYWTAPYLHDGGVSVGDDIRQDLGISGTLLKGKNPDPYNSLKALVDKELRAKVIQANKSSPQLRQVHVEGGGHEYWVDPTTGFTKEEQEALISYLLSIE
jgi:hypothetical protein